MADVDALIDGLRGGGAVAARGQFTLDAEKARDKLRMFQLADPQRWIVLVVQALAARGARRIDVRIDTDEVRIDSDAPAFAPAELSDLSNVLLGELAVAPGLRELALGLNAALALEPRWLRVDAIADGTGVRVEQRPGATDRIEALTTGEPGVRVHLQERLGLGLLARFFRVGGAGVREHELLRRHRPTGALALTLDGARVPALPRDADVPRWHDVIIDGTLRGVVGISHEGGEARIELTRHQLWMTTHGSNAAEFVGVRAIVDASSMRTDVSMAELVRDESYDALLDAVQRAADVAVLDVLGEDFGLPSWLEAHVAARIAMRGLVHPLSPTMRAWVNVPIWTRLGGTRATTAELDARPTVAFSDVHVDEPPPEIAMIIDGSNGAAARLRAVFDERCRDHTRSVEHMVKRVAARRAFESRVHPHALPNARTYTACTPIVDAEGVLGTLGVHDGNNERGWIRVVLGERLLVELPVELPLSRVHAVIWAPLTPSELFDDVVRDDAFSAAVYASFVAYDAAVRAYVVERFTAPDEDTVESLIRHLRFVSSDEHPIAWLVALGIDEPRARELVQDPAPQPWRVRPEHLTGAQAHPLLRLPLFTDAGDAPVDLLTIAAYVREHGSIGVIAKGRPGLTDLTELLVRVDEKRMQLLTALFGAKAIERAGHRLDRWVARARFREQNPVAPLEPPLPCELGPFAIEVDGRAASAGLSTRGDESAWLRLCLDARVLAGTKQPSVLRGLTLALEIDPAWVKKSYDGVEGVDAQWGLAHAVAASIGAIAQRIGDAPDQGPFARAALVITMAGIAWPDSVWLDAWLALRRELGERAGTLAYGELLELRDAYANDELRAALLGFLEQSVAPIPARVAAELEREKAVPRPRAAQALAVVECAEVWTELACLPTVGGAQRSFAELIAARGSGERLGWVAPGERGAPTGALVLDDAQARICGTVLGRATLFDRAPELRIEQRRAEFEKRPQRAGLGLDDPDPLVEVELDEPKLKGTLGLPRMLPGSGRGRVVVCNGRREVCTVDPVEGTSYLGTIDGAGLGEPSGFIALTTAELEQVRSCCKRRRGALLRALLRAWGDSDALDVLCAAWIKHLLVDLVPRSRASHVVLAREGVAELVELPLFVDTLGNRLTLAMLRAELDTHEELAVVTKPGLVLDRMLVHARDALELAQLHALFEVVTDAEPAAQARAALERSIAAAPPLPRPPAAAFARVAIDDRELQGELWIDEHTHDGSTIWLGHQGRAIEQRQVSKMFPCGGAIGGQGVELAETKGRCRLTRARTGLLRARSSALYLLLIATVREAVPPADDPRVRVLTSLLLRLHAITAGGRPWPNHEQRRCYRELRELPLLALPNGRAISLDVALRERPRALAKAGLWEDDGRDLDAPAPEPELASDDDDAPEPIAAPEPMPMPAPTPAPQAIEPLAPPPPDPPELTLARAVRDELRMLRGRDESLFAELYVERVTVEVGPGELIAIGRDGAVVLDAAHPVVARALAGPEPLLVSLLASATFTVLNVLHESLTDEQEARVLVHHVAHLRTAASRTTD